MLWSDDVCHDCIGAHYQSLARVLPAVAGMADNLPLRNKGCFGFLPLERLKLERRQFVQIPERPGSNHLVEWKDSSEFGSEILIGANLFVACLAAATRLSLSFALNRASKNRLKRQALSLGLPQCLQLCSRKHI